MIRNERTKLTVAYLNAGASSFLTAGVVAPIAAAIFGLTSSTAGPSSLTSAIGVLMLAAVSLGFHIGARYGLKGLLP